MKRFSPDRVLISSIRVSPECHKRLFEMSKITNLPVTRIAAAILERVLIDKVIDFKIVNPIEIIKLKEGLGHE